MQSVVVQQAGPTVTGPCNKPFLAAARPPSRKCSTVSLRYRSATRSRFTTLEPGVPVHVEAVIGCKSQLAAQTGRLWLPEQYCVGLAVRETQEPAHYVEGSEYLKSLGFQHASEVARVLDIAMNPTSIYLQNKHKRRSVNISVSVSMHIISIRCTATNACLQAPTQKGKETSFTAIQLYRPGS